MCVVRLCMLAGGLALAQQPSRRHNEQTQELLMLLSPLPAAHHGRQWAARAAGVHTPAGGRWRAPAQPQASAAAQQHSVEHAAMRAAHGCVSSASSGPTDSQTPAALAHRRSKLPKSLDPVHLKVLACIRSRRLLAAKEHVLIPIDGSLASTSLAAIMTAIKGVWDLQLHIVQCSTVDPHTLQQLATKHSCSALLLPTTATECAAQLLDSFCSGSGAAGVSAGHVRPAWSWQLQSQQQSDIDVRVVQPLLLVMEPELEAMSQRQAHTHSSQEGTPHAHTNTTPVPQARTNSSTTSATQTLPSHSTPAPQTLQAAAQPEAHGNSPQSGFEFQKHHFVRDLAQHFQPACELALTRTAVLVHENAEYAAAYSSVAGVCGLPAGRPEDAPKPPSSGPVGQATQGQRQASDVSEHHGAASGVSQGGGDPVASRVAAYIRDKQLLLRGQRVLVAVSGGQDSLALLHWLTLLKDMEGWELVVGHCDHGWRADSADNARAVSRLASAWDLPCLVRRAPDPRAIASEAAARRWRYRALADMAAEAGCDVVATGHTRSDQVETQILNLVRGTGPANLLPLHAHISLAIPTHSHEDMLDVPSPADPQPPHFANIRSTAPPNSTLHVVRPLLSVWREETGNIASTLLGQYLYLDSTNNDPDITRRNRLRLQFVPMLRDWYGPCVEERIHSACAAAVGQARVVQGEAGSVLAESRVLVPVGVMKEVVGGRSGKKPTVLSQVLDRRMLRTHPAAVQRGVLHTWLRDVPGLEQLITYESVDQVLQLMTAPSRTRTGTLAVLRGSGELARWASEGMGATRCCGFLDAAVSDAKSLRWIVTVQAYRDLLLLMLTLQGEAGTVRK